MSVNSADILPNETSEQPEQPTPMAIILQLQQQQMAMQEQMTTLMSRLLPTAVNQPPTQTRSQRMKPERPIIDADSSDNKWIIFQDAWNRYKEMTALRNVDEIRNELRSACTAAVNEMLFNFVGPEVLNNATEDELLEHIKSVAVKTVHPEVYRQQFFVMKQSDGESITSFVSRLKSQAMLCAFKKKCDCINDRCETSFSEEMIRSQVISGLRNASHQTKILTEVSALPTLSALIERLLTLESTARATNHFQPGSISSQVGRIKSEYQRSKSAIHRKPNDAAKQSKDTPSNPKCKGCGWGAHLNGRKQCPAFGKNCNKCGKPNHFSSVCQSSTTSAGIHQFSEYDGTVQQEEEISYISTMSADNPL